ncbi:MAG: EthD family reductase [Acidimicrobiales bacterium]
MMRMSVLYPVTEGATFDHDYYRTNHVPLCSETWKPVRVEVDRGVDGPYVAAVHFVFESADALQAALGGPGTASITADVANYTTIVPVLQISETT